MSMGNEIKELTGQVEALSTENVELKAQIEEAIRLSAAKDEAHGEIVKLHAEELAGMQDALQTAQTDLSGALEINEDLLSNLNDAEAEAEEAEEKVELAEAAVEASVEAIAAKDAKLANPAIVDASAEGESEAADLDATEPINVLAQMDAITDQARRHEFWQQNKVAIDAANKEAKEKE